MEEEKPLEATDEESACSILEYKWGKTYSNEKLLEFGEKNLISSSCVNAIISERKEKERSEWEK